LNKRQAGIPDEEGFAGNCRTLAGRPAIEVVTLHGDNGFEVRVITVHLRAGS
jgi:hypothetical protein